MKGTNLGEFEELVLLSVAVLIEDACSVAICDELSNQTGRSVKLGVVHSVLSRLEEKELGEVSWVKQRRPVVVNAKGFYHLTIPEKAALVRTKSIRCGTGYRRLTGKKC